MNKRERPKERVKRSQREIYVQKNIKGEIKMKLHVVLVEPEIPQNTGNIARTCAAIGAKLHLVHPLGFSISEKAVKRAGLDYWDKLDIEEHISFKEFLNTCFL